MDVIRDFGARGIPSERTVEPNGVRGRGPEGLDDPGGLFGILRRLICTEIKRFQGLTLRVEGERSRKEIGQSPSVPQGEALGIVVEINVHGLGLCSQPGDALGPRA